MVKLWANLNKVKNILCDHIVTIIVLLKRWLLQIEQGLYRGVIDKKDPFIKRIGNKASYPFFINEELP